MPTLETMLQFVPESVVITSTKSDDGEDIGEGTFYISNNNQFSGPHGTDTPALNGTVSLASFTSLTNSMKTPALLYVTTCSDESSLLAAPTRYTAPFGSYCNVKVEIAPTGLPAGTYTVTLDVTAMTANTLPILIQQDLTLEISARVASTHTRVNISGSPVLGDLFDGISIVPRDSDNFPIEDVQYDDVIGVTIFPHEERHSVLCEVAWRNGDGSSHGCYVTVCNVPNMDFSSWWHVNVSLNGAVFFSSVLGLASCKEEHFTSYGGLCTPCPNEATCSSHDNTTGWTLQTLKLKPGYYRVSDTSTTIRECPHTDACKGGDDASNYCADGYTAALCAVCDTSHFRHYGNCLSCDDHSINVVPALTAVLLLTTVLVLFVRNRRFGALRQFVWRALQVELKIVWTTVQILTQFPSTLPYQYIPHLTFKILDFTQFANLNPLSVLGLSCADSAFESFNSQLLFYLVAPAATALIVALVSGGRVLALGVSIESAKQTALRGCMFLSYLVLPSTSAVVFQAFVCDDDFGEGHRYLVADYSVDCTGPEHATIKTWAWFGVLMYPAGINLFYVVTLARSRMLSDEERRKSSVAMLCGHYRAERFWWEPIDSIRRIALSGLLVFCGDGSRIAIGLLLAIFFQVLHHLARPYANAKDNVIAGIGNFQIVLTLLMLLMVQAGALHTLAIGILTVICNLAVLLAVCFTQASRLQRRRRVYEVLDQRRDGDGLGHVGAAPVAEASDDVVGRSQSHRASIQWTDATTGTYQELDLDHFMEVWSAGSQSREEVRKKLHDLCYEYLFRPPVGKMQRKALLHLLRLPPMHLDDPSTGSMLLGLKLKIDLGSSRFAKIVWEPEDGTTALTAAPALLNATRAERDAGARVAILCFADGLADETVVVDQISRTVWRVSPSLEIGVEAVRCETSLWIMLQTVAAFRSTQIMAEMQCYKEEARQSEGGRKVIEELPMKFGTVEQTLCDPANQLAGVVEDNPHKNELCETLDADVLVPFAVLNGRAAHEFFRNKLQSLFPSAQIFESVDDAMDSNDQFALLIAPVKGSARIKVKVEEYRSEFDNDPAQYPCVTKVGDILRATVVCADGDSLHTAWMLISSEGGFDVRERHGRLKNNFRSKQTRPPDMLINCVIEGVGFSPLVGEIQIHLRSILALKEMEHMHYEVRRAPTALALLGEAGIKYELPSQDAVPTTESTTSMATVGVVEGETSAVGDSEAEWEAHTDEATGVVYYHNKRLRRTTWTEPGTEPELETVAASTAADEIELTELFQSAVVERESSNPMHESVVPIKSRTASL